MVRTKGRRFSKSAKSSGDMLMRWRVDCGCEDNLLLAASLVVEENVDDGVILAVDGIAFERLNGDVLTIGVLLAGQLEFLFLGGEACWMISSTVMPCGGFSMSSPSPRSLDWALADWESAVALEEDRAPAGSVKVRVARNRTASPVRTEVFISADFLGV